MTDKGQELAPILLALQQWGDRYKADPEGPPVVVRHAGCGKDVRAALTCGRGHEVAWPDDIKIVDGPGALPAVPA